MSGDLGSLSRRRFLSWLGWGSVALSVGGVVTASAVSLRPQLTYEPTSAFTVGRPEEYQLGEMRAFEARRVFIFRTPQGFQALSMTCTHLGCAYKPYGPPDDDFPVVHAHCPCHGSVFARDGRVLGGPAPRPLPFYAMSLTPDGRLQVDLAQTWPSTTYLTVDGRVIPDGPVPTGEDIRFA
jgi:cytochrome b6-f complex iron-sulfur subunit